MERMHDGRGYPGQQSGRRGPPVRERYDDRPVRRPNDFHPDRYESHDRGRVSMRHRHDSQRRSFDDEMQELAGAVDKAMNFYGGFLHSFRQEVQYVESYASPPLLDYLWMDKVYANGKRSSTTKATHRDSAGHGSQSSGSFPGMAHTVSEHVEDTIRAASDALKSGRESENAGRVGSKLSKMYGELKGHLNKASGRAKNAEILMTELEMLRTFLAANGARRASREIDGRIHHEQRDGEEYEEQGGGGDYDGGSDDGQGKCAVHTNNPMTNVV